MDADGGEREEADAARLDGGKTPVVASRELRRGRMVVS
jgi:hypothetical protein